MERKTQKIFIIICLLFICTPLILVTLRIKVDSKFSAKKINGNFERNFPLKEDFYKVFDFIKEEIFNANPIPDKVVQLKDGWLFCGDSFSDNLSESLHYVNFKTTALDSLQNDLIEKDNWCKEHNINYLLAIAPNKETVYSDLIPIAKLEQNSKMEQLDSICNQNKIGYIDLGKDFPENSEQILYHKTDTHWNEYAGYFGYTSILENINKECNLDIKPLPISNYEIVNTDEIIGDLNEIRGREKDEPLVGMKVVNYSEEAKIAPKKLAIPNDYPNDPSSYERRYVNPNKKLKIIVFCDSFGGYFVKFLKEHFGETIFIWRHEFDKELILNEKPDIIIQEFVERHVDYLLEPNI